MVALSLLAATLALARTALAASRPLTIPAFSPLFTYAPEKNGYASAGQWEQSTTEYSPVGEKQDLMTLGEKYIWATGSGGEPSVSYTFNGSSISFVGYWGTPLELSSGLVSLIVDGAEPRLFTAPDVLPAKGVKSVLASATFDAGPHEVKLVVTAGTVSMSSVDVTLDFPGVEQDVLDKAATRPNITGTAIVKNGKYDRNPVFTTSGKWDVFSEYPSRVWPRLSCQVDGGWIYLEIPKGNVFLRINGSTRVNSYEYSVELDPPPPGLEGTVRRNHHSNWTTLDAPLYMVRLDPEVAYSIKVIDWLNPKNMTKDRFLDVHSYETWAVESFNTSDSGSQGNSTGTPTGTGDKGAGASNAGATTNNIPVIVGCVIAAIVITALVVLAIVYRKRLAALCHRNKDTDSDPDKLEIDTVRVDGYQQGYLSQPPSSSVYITPTTPFVTSPITPTPGSTTLSHDFSSQSSEPKSIPWGDRRSGRDDMGLYKDLNGQLNHRGPAHPVEVEIITQARDAGRPVVRERVVPPLYDPAWRTSVDEGEFDSSASTVSARESAGESARDSRDIMGENNPHVWKR